MGEWKKITKKQMDGRRLLFWNIEDEEPAFGFYNKKLRRWYSEKYDDNLKIYPKFYFDLPELQEQ